MATTSTVEGKKTNTTNCATSPICGESNNGNTVYVHVDPSRFRAVVQKLTGAPTNLTPTLPISSLPSAKRPKLQERRRGMPPARLDIPFATHLQMISQIQKPTGDLALSPVSTIDYAFFFASNSPLSSSYSPTSSTKIAGPIVVLTKEEEDREEKAIAEKGFYLHHSPRGGEYEAKPKLLPLFPVISSEAMRFSSSIRS
ncbi:hypothetical protein LUZ63_000107 [Rhynchospora breviuscula]|uniref:VQ domain-containing protein n=1 Tax=Rhynchospora breviuscula TaxID=2022672 RepID=A0A9Q0CUA5_9POAL|nr:hypothetical protein LUZ63_000107 [Rhynchospora breviuscula]